MNNKPYPPYDKQKFAKHIGLAFLFSFVIFSMASASSAETSLYIVPDKNFFLRTGPSLQHPVIEPALLSGTSVKAIIGNDDKDWSKIATEDGRSGWIENKSLSTQKPDIAKLELTLRRTEVLNNENDRLRRQVNKLSRQVS